MTTPNQSHPLNAGGPIDPVWLRYLQRLESSANTSELSAQIAAIATALGSPDGTVANIPAQGNSATIVGTGPVKVTGSLASGQVTVGGRTLTDTETGTFKLIDARDEYGRITGLADGSAADVPYDNATSGLAATDVQAAIDEMNSGGGVPYFVPDGKTYTVAANKQALFTIPIELDGDAMLVIDGALVEVS